MQHSRLHFSPSAKIAILLAVLMLLGSFVSAPKAGNAVQQAPGACDDFTDYDLGMAPPPVVWEVQDGTWLVMDDAGNPILQQADDTLGNPTDPRILLVLDGFNDFGTAGVTAKIRPDSGSKDIGVIFRAQDVQNYYLFRVDGTAGTAGFFKREAGVYSSLGPETPFVVSMGTWYEFNVVAIGSNFRAYIDGAFVNSASDGTYASGMLGLRTHTTAASFDDVCVSVGPFTWDVDDNATECPNPDFTVIQDAINFAAPLDTVHVCAGIYPEQLTIQKSIKLSGDGPTSIVQYPASPRPLDPAKLITMISPDDTQADPLVWVATTTNVTLEKLMFDGNEDLVTDGSAVSAGVIYKNAKGAVQNSTITNFQDPDCLSCDTGYGIWGEPAGSTLLVQNNLCSEIQKNHITGKFGDVKAIGNTLTGQGPVATTNQYGILLSDGATGVVLNNTISGFNFTPAGTESAGIALLNAANGITISGNTLSGNELAIFIDPTNNGKLLSNTISSSATADITIENSSGWLVTQNTLNNSLGKGLVLTNISNSQVISNKISNTAEEGILLQSIAGGAANSNQFIQNTFSGIQGNGVKLFMDGTAGNSASGNSFTSNTIQNGLENGIQFDAVGANRFQNTTLKANKIKDNAKNGMATERSNNAKIEFNTVTGNMRQGILLGPLSNGSTVKANTVKANKRHGIALTGNSDNNKFMFNTSKTNGNGTTYFDMFWDQNAGATGNTAVLNFFTTEKPAFFWN